MGEGITVISKRNSNPSGDNYDNAIFFGKGGNDSNDGFSPAQKKLTLAGAKTAASALTPAADNQIAIVGLGAGTFSENYTNVAFVHLIAQAIKITGDIVVAESCMVNIGILNGDLTVDAAKTLECLIHNITGSITKTGNIYGRIGTDLYITNIVTG